MLPPTTNLIPKFRQQYPNWAARFTGDEPVYALPIPAIDCLAKALRQDGEALFDKETANAERAFTSMCQKNYRVGFRDGGMIEYPILSDRQVNFSDSDIATFNFQPGEIAVLRGLLADCDETRARLRGVVGWLLTEQAFLKEVAEVRRQYTLIPKEVRPPFPLTRVPQVPNVAGPPPGAFTEALAHLLDRWGLMSLVYWDLPNPQGPLFPDELPADSLAKPTHGVHIYVPAHYPLQGDDHLQRKIAEFQRKKVIDQGIDPSFAGNTHYKTYERMFDVIHVERSIRRRFGKRPRGLVGGIEIAAAAVLGRAVGRVQGLRRMIAACLAGNRKKVR